MNQHTLNKKKYAISSGKAPQRDIPTKFIFFAALIILICLGEHFIKTY